MKNIILSKLIKEFIKDKKIRKLRELINTVHMVDIADTFKRLKKKEREKIYQEMSPDNLAELIKEISPEEQEELVSSINNKKLKATFDEMANDDIVDLFGELEEEAVRNLMKLLDEDEREEVQKLRIHERDTAGGLMTTDYFSIESGSRVGEVIREIKTQGDDAELVYYVYITEPDEGKLMGVVSLRQLILSQANTIVDTLMETNIVTVKPGTDQEEVANYISKYNLLAIPVINEDGNIQGIITVDDIIDVIEEEATEDIYAMAGLTEDEMEDNKHIFSSVKIRLPWLMVSLFGELLSATIMAKFGDALEKTVALAFFIPLIMAMGGNSGSQSSAVMVRKIALGETKSGKLSSLLKKESFAGIFLGMISGIIVTFLVYLWRGNLTLGVTIGIALFVAISTAAIFGTVIPLIFNKYKIDPAVASGPFITTLNDIGGLVIYFTVANLIFAYFGG